MIELRPGQMPLIAPLFEGWEETLIWSCLQGVMGRAWADALSGPAPRAARIAVGDFIFFAGDAARGERLVSELPSGSVRPILLLIPPRPDGGWSELIERCHPDRHMRTTRYALAKEPGVFDRDGLRAMAAAPAPGITLQPFTRALHDRALAMDWSVDFCSQFDGWRDYEDRGVGVAAVTGGSLVGGASSYTVYNGGIEIEIATHPDWRRRGIARACAATLILTCLDRGLYPSWDAANPESRDLAVKLGYRFTHTYPAYAVTTGPRGAGSSPGRPAG